MDPVPDTMTSGVQANVRIAPSVIPTLQKLPRTQQAAVVAAIGLIGKEPGTPLELLHAGETRQYLAAVPKADADAPVVVYRQLQDREGGGYLVTGLSDRDTFRAYERPRSGGLGVADAAMARQENQRFAPPIQPVRLRPRPSMLIGREGMLSELQARLEPGDGAGPRIVALCGLGGAGKSSVAVEYAYRHLAEVGVAWQFSAEDPAVLAAGFAELAAQLGIPDSAESRDPVAAVHAVLARFSSGWLLIFDNAPDMASVAAFLPPAGPGQILITSTNPNWPGESLEVPVLDDDTAARFLVARTGDQDLPTARELASALGGLPLALVQAAAYITATGQSQASYLALFRQRRVDLLSRGEPGGHGKTVATTWELAFKRLQQTCASAVGLLQLLAFYAPDAIPLHLLLRPRPELTGQLSHEVIPVLVPLMDDRLAADNAVRALRQYSLVTPAADGSVSVHPLVQAVTADDMTEDLARAWRQAAALLIEAAIPDHPEDPSSWPVFGALLPHAQAALPADRRGLELMAYYLGYSGNYAAARDLLRGVHRAKEHEYGQDDPNTLISARGFARWTGEAGDAAGARDQYAALLPVMERVLGPDHRDALIARRGLAFWTGEAATRPTPATSTRRWCPSHGPGPRPRAPRYPHRPQGPRLLDRGGRRRAGARDQYAALLPVMERVSGPDHPETLATRNYLARYTGEGPATQPAPGTGTRRCCRSWTESSAQSTPIPSSPAGAWPSGPGSAGNAQAPGTSTQRCCPSWNGSSAQSTQPR